MSLLEGWAIKITRDDGTFFMAGSGTGDVPAVWHKRNRKYAVKHKKELRKHDLRAKVVPVLYNPPEVCVK